MRANYSSHLITLTVYKRKKWGTNPRFWGPVLPSRTIRNLTRYSLRVPYFFQASVNYKLLSLIISGLKQEKEVFSWN